MALKKQEKDPTMTQKKARKPVSKKTVVKKVTGKTARTSTRKMLKKEAVASSPKKKTFRGLAAGMVGSDSKEERFLKLPKNMSKRAIEKSIVLNSEFDKYFRESIYRIAYVSSLCFVLVGTTLLAGQTLEPELGQKMFGQVISTTDTTVIDSTNTTATLTDLAVVEAIPDPIFTLFEAVPKQLDEPYRVLFSVTNASEVVARMVEVGKVGFFNLSTDNISDNKYRVDIPVDKLTPSYYQLKFYVRPTNNPNDLIVFESNVFHVGPTITTSATDSDNIDNTTTDVTTDITTSADTEMIIIDPLVSSVTTFDNQTPDAFALVKPEVPVLSGVARLAIAVPENYSYIELYVRPVQSLSTRFVGLATKRFEHWQFVFNSADLPNGRYEFFAKSKVDGDFVETNPIVLSVSNVPLITIRPPSTNATTINPDSTKTTERPLVRIENEVFVPFEGVNNDTERETTRLLAENTDDINMLLARYAVARQSGDEILIEAARKALEEKREAIVFNTLQDQRLRDISDDIDSVLKERIEDLENRVDTFEQIRNDRSSGQTAVDTDGDGISDYDETNLYGTNPEAADSDNDGVTDGIEIMRGYDPTNDEPEAVIVFESPKESIGLIREDSLKVESVSPVKMIEPTDELPPVRTEIRGQGLPNSYVTIYIFSTPTVVTIRTDADGSFVYTFDKELEDGMHDVYVAVTDNAGKIIAQSNPFSFVKTAEAFTPVDATEAEVITTDVVSESTGGAYNMVVGIGILALGGILLMLGISLRPKREEEGVDTLGKNDGKGLANEVTIPKVATVNSTNSPTIKRKAANAATKIEHIEAT